jgi:hypothetical protein
MTQATEEWSGYEAYEHMTWCDAVVKKMRELSEEEGFSWWENECQKPDWLEIQPEDAESIHSFADRLEQEEFEWAETWPFADSRGRQAARFAQFFRVFTISRN